MNYYQFHIADWALHTSHLTLEEEAVYRRLLDHYYDTESPIPEETNPVIRRLRLRGFEETVLEILQEFFVLDSGGWHNRRADVEIAAYQLKADQARENGKRGGRPKKNNDLQKEKTENPKETNPVNSGNPEKSGSKANQEPRTINQSLKTSSSEADAPDDTGKQNPPAVSQKYSDDDYRFAEGMFASVLKVAPKTTQPDLNKWAVAIRRMREIDGRTHAEIAEVFRYANRDEFWKVNILSPVKLREKFARLDAQMRSQGNAKRNGTSAEKWAIDHDDTAWLTERTGPGDCGAGEPDIPAVTGTLHRLEERR